MLCFNSNKTTYDCDAATVLLHVCIHLVFVGKGYLALVPSHLPHLRLLNLEQCDNVCDEYLEELVAAVPELVVINYYGDTVEAVENKTTFSSNSKDTDE
jgi:hypothetical protein